MYPETYFLFLIWVSFVFAKLEIAIEGKRGWAAGLPTWRLPETNWASMLFFAGKPATGYHVWMETFILSILHMTYLFVPFSIAIELQIVAFFMFFSVLEDFLWFVLNPAFGIKNFRKDKIWWHQKSWMGIAPGEYFLFTALGFLLYFLSFQL
ncbi:hypothetical protein C4568_00825 [Candidatus Parcubacteria bacterium]|nr:MAG: hypothetical protein C4568_00825 [Candidatus Parcubacteria bacterium]